MISIATPIARFAVRTLVTYAYVRMSLDIIELSAKAGRKMKVRFAR